MLLGILFFCLANESPQISQEVKAYLDQRTAFGYEPSIVVGLVSPKGIDMYASGFQELGKTNASESTVYEIGSISKVFTSLLLMDAVSKGLVNLDDPAQKYLPESVKMPTRGKKQITLRHLASHTSSLPRMPMNIQPKDMSNPYADYTVKQLYACLNATKLNRDIGERHEYSNLATGLLGHIMELVHGKRYDVLVKDIIAEPFGMKDTVMAFLPNQKARIAQGYNMDLKPVSHWDIPTLAGAGALRSTVVDMLVFLKLQLGFIDSPLVATARKTHVTQKEVAPNVGVALGWHATLFGEQRILWHNGGTGGFRSYAGFDAEKQLGVVVLTNGTLGADDIGVHLLNKEQPLRKVYKAVTLKPEEFDAIIGTYSGEGPDLEIRLEGKQLIAQRTGRPANPIYTASPETCFYRLADITITFKKDASGKAIGAVFEAFGQKTSYQRKP